jgi:DNA polymerase III epsilon subunit-like protein
MKTFLDTETTGLKPGHIAQLTYILTDDDLQIQKTQNLFFKIPEGSMEEGAQNVHGLYEEVLNDLSNGKTFSNSAFKILKDIQNSTLICHNVAFDLNYLKTEFEECGIIYNPNTFCTMEHFTPLCKLPPKPGKTGYKWPRLQETLNFLNIAPEEALEKTRELFGESNGFHDSRFDTVGLFMIYKKGKEMGLIE